MTSKEILGVRVDFGLTCDDVVNIVDSKLLKDGRPHYICTTNPEFIVCAQKDEDFKEIINKSDLSVPDGVGVVIAKDYLDEVSKLNKNIFYPIKAFIKGLNVGLKGTQNSQTVTGVELTYKLTELAANKGYSVFYLGGRPRNASGNYTNSDDKEMSHKVADIFREKYPNIRIIGATSRYVAGVNDDTQTLEYMHHCMINSNVDNIDIVFVAYGHPNQERWINRNISKIPAKVCMGVGGTFDYIVGHSMLPPDKYVKRNLGWLYRLLSQPWRIKRVMSALPGFALKVFLNSLR